MTHERIQKVIMTPSTWGLRSSEFMMVVYSMFRDVNVGFVLDVTQQTKRKRSNAESQRVKKTVRRHNPRPKEVGGRIRSRVDTQMSTAREA